MFMTPNYSQIKYLAQGVFNSPWVRPSTSVGPPDVLLVHVFAVILGLLVPIEVDHVQTTEKLKIGWAMIWDQDNQWKNVKWTIRKSNIDFNKLLVFTSIQNYAIQYLNKGFFKFVQDNFNSMCLFRAGMLY